MSRVWNTLRKDKLYDEIIFDDIHSLKGHFVSCQKVKYESDIKNVIFVYHDGSLYRYYEKKGEIIKEETMYVHFQKRELEIKTENLSKYVIVPNEFIPYEEPNLNLLEKYGKKRYFYFQAFKIRWNNLIKKIIRF